MDQIPKHIKRGLRQLADRAYELELARELAALEDEFARWHRGERTPFDVSEAIHSGILDRTQIAPDVLQELAGALSMYEASESAQ